MKQAARPRKTILDLTRISTILFLVLAFIGGSVTAAKAQVIRLANATIVEEQGSHSIYQARPGDSKFLQYTPKQIGDSITFRVTVEEKGMRSVQVTSYKDGYEGIYSMEVDGKELGRKDFHHSNVWELGRFEVVPGDYEVTFRCVGKAPKSPGLGLKFGNLSFR